MPKAVLNAVCLFVLSLVWALSAGAPSAVAAAGMPEVVFILDGSGSMWGAAGGQKKIVAAKQVMAKVMPALPAEVKVGLVAYGHRRKGDCSDVEVLIRPGSVDRRALLAKVSSLQPKGKTPIAESIKMVAELLRTRESETTIVLVSDGEETCHPDPCGVVRALKNSGIKFVLHVVGFGVGQRGQAQLSCLAKAGGGSYFAASDAASLGSALSKVQAAVVQKVQAAKSRTVRRSTGLGKLRLIIPPAGLATLAEIRIVRTKDNKVIKKAKPAADATHPLLAGQYRVVLGYANANYKPPTFTPVAEVSINGGQTTELKMGVVVISRAKGLGDAAQAVGLVNSATGKTLFTLQAHGNDYYLWKPKPVPAGAYTMTFTYARNKTPFAVAGDVRITPGGQAVVTLDSGIKLKPVASIMAWYLTAPGGQKPVLEVKRRSDNDYPLWEAFPLQPGSYDLWVRVRGMDEPLPAAQGIEIKKGETLKFDTGL